MTGRHSRYPGHDPLAEPLLTVAEAAAILGVSTKTVERLRNSGLLDTVEVGTGPRPRVYYRQADVLTHLADRHRDHEQTLPGATA